MNKILTLSFLVIIFNTGCNSDPNEKIRKQAWGQHFVSVEQCINDGIEYSKKIGTYPYFQRNITEGRHIKDIAKERCNKTFDRNGSATAFYFKLSIDDMAVRTELYHQLEDDKYKNL